SKIITNLKRLSRNELETMQTVSINDYLDDLQNFISQRIKNNGIKLIEKYKEKESFDLETNQVAVSQILINLLNNAIDELSETVEKNKDHKPVIEIDTINNKESLVIEISDNGRGVEKDKVDLIFNPLFTSKEVGKGTGLGLSLSKNLAKQMNAQIVLQQDKYTRFQVIFPKKEAL
ncbi:MAG: HAMP domain-containing histidine kinase, partial [Halobacteriovoraceae bacterium]|nr:HAMP domain-containing histidine kinase [Halobacteriovoraceae bacterium]